MSDHDDTAVLSATARHATAHAHVQALAQRLRALQQTDPFTRSDQEEDEIGRLERRIGEMEGLLPSLAAARRQERATVDVQALQDDWAPLMAAKQQAYAELSLRIRAVWDQMAALEALHQSQEALLQAVPDDEVRRYMLNTFWVDSNTMRLRAAGNMYPELAWSTFFVNPLGYRVGAGPSISKNDPGVTPIPPAIIRNVQSGQLFVERAHRG